MENSTSTHSFPSRTKKNETIKTYDLLGESIVLVNSKGSIKAFWNICPHRGARLKEGNGSGASIVCPYHGWAFDLDGNCIHRRLVQGKYDEIRLLSPKMIIKWGLIFISKKGSLEDFCDAGSKLDIFMEKLKPEELSIVEDYSSTTHTNWKLFVENFLECYHCYINHPELTNTEKFIRSYEQGDSLDEALEISNFDEGFDIKYLSYSYSESIPYLAASSGLVDKKRSETKSGKLVAPSLTGLKGIGGRVIYGMYTPFLHFTINVDHIVFFYSTLPM